jgi:hypothetical protein
VDSKRLISRIETYPCRTEGTLHSQGSTYIFTTLYRPGRDEIWGRAPTFPSFRRGDGLVKNGYSPKHDFSQIAQEPGPDGGKILIKELEERRIRRWAEDAKYRRTMVPAATMPRLWFVQH